MDEVDAARALLYRLLAHALVAPPPPGLLARLTRLDGDVAPLGTALRELAARAQSTTPASAHAEYDALFIGVARGELLPYASFYLTGFLHERPLARIRADLGAIGLAPAAGRSDPEDHIAFLCEVMASLIDRGDIAAEARFFTRHLGPWAPSFFSDLEAANAAQLYRPVGTIGRLLVALDSQGFAYMDHQTRGAA